TRHPRGTGLFRVFSDMPAIFARDLADDGLQVEQSVTAWLGAGKMGRQARMQMEQAHRPAAHLTQGWLGLLCGGMMVMLHAFLVSDGQLTQEVFVLLECHIGARSARSFCWFGNIPGKIALLTRCDQTGHVSA